MVDTDTAPALLAEALPYVSTSAMMAAWDDKTEQRKCVSDLRDRITALLDSGGWMPIETAPKDGASILVHCGGDLQAVCYWSTSLWVSKGGAWIYEECRSDTVELEPTHWQPLPPLPKG